MKRETRAAFKARLEGEGLWPAAVTFREDLKAGGMGATDAWAKTYERFPSRDGKLSQSDGVSPEPSEQGAGDSPAPAVAAPPETAATPAPQPRRRRRGSQRVELKDELLWAYQNLDVANPSRPPSAGAMAMLNAAKENRWEFLKLAIQRLVTPKTGKEDETSKAGQVQDQQALDLLDDFMREYEKKGAA